MMIGSFSQIPYRTFAARLSPIALIGLALTIAVILIVYRKEFRSGGAIEVEKRSVRVNRVLMWKSIAASAAMLILFFSGWPVPKVAIVIGALLLITRRVKPERIYQRIDWSLLAMFAGLFIVIAGMEKTPLNADLTAAAGRLRLDNTFVLSAFTAALSNIVSNVPAVLMFKPIAAHAADQTRYWLTLAMSSTLAGNLTVVGSVANLIVIQQARHKVRVGFWEYFRVGGPLAILTILLGAAWLEWAPL
jgi:Na+/H+ antiporter NhaD/arsenite permease-like protein